MSRPTVWLNKNLSSTFDVIEILRAAAARAEDQLRILASHTDPDSPVCRVCDHFEVEPKTRDEAAYVDFCLEFVRRHQIDVFLPGKHLRATVRARDRFEAAGA